MNRARVHGLGKLSGLCKAPPTRLHHASKDVVRRWGYQKEGGFRRPISNAKTAGGVCVWRLQQLLRPPRWRSRLRDTAPDGLQPYRK